MVERGGKGRVMAFVTLDVKAATLFPIIEEKILPSSIVNSDEYSVDDRLATPSNGYDHRRI
jgi:transposase-like protein